MSLHCLWFVHSQGLLLFLHFKVMGKSKIKMRVEMALASRHAPYSRGETKGNTGRRTRADKLSQLPFLHGFAQSHWGCWLDAETI